MLQCSVPVPRGRQKQPLSVIGFFLLIVRLQAHLNQPPDSLRIALYPRLELEILDLLPKARGQRYRLPDDWIVFVGHDAS
jgi:hypothetical protein